MPTWSPGSGLHDPLGGVLRGAFGLLAASTWCAFSKSDTFDEGYVRWSQLSIIAELTRGTNAYDRSGIGSERLCSARAVRAAKPRGCATWVRC